MQPIEKEVINEEQKDNLQKLDLTIKNFNEIENYLSNPDLISNLDKFSGLDVHYRFPISFLVKPTNFSKSLSFIENFKNLNRFSFGSKGYGFYYFYLK